MKKVGRNAVVLGSVEFDPAKERPRSAAPPGSHFSNARSGPRLASKERTRTSGTRHQARLPVSSNPHSNGQAKSVDECLNHIVADILRRRPRNGKTVIRPKANGSRTPTAMGIKNGQLISSAQYALPSWRMGLKRKMPNNVSEAVEFDPGKGAGFVRSKNVAGAASTVTLNTLVCGNPHLHFGRNGERLSKPLSNSPSKERI